MLKPYSGESMLRSALSTLPIIAMGCVNIHPVADTLPPDIVILSPNDDSTHNPENIVFCAHIFDEDPIEGLDVELTSDVDGGVTPAWDLCSGGNFGGTIALTTEGTHTLTVSATDSAKNQSSASVSINALEDAPAVNTAPSCTISSPADGATVEFGSTLDFEATIADLEDELVSLTAALSSDVDGELWSGTADNAGAVSVELTDLSSNAHTLTLTVSDSEPLTGDCTVGISVEES
jgi:hypothetical protein